MKKAIPADRNVCDRPEKESEIAMNARIAAILPELVELRHAFHRTPEIAGEEFETSARIRAELAGLPLDVRPPLLGTDVVAVLDTGRPGPNILLRADMDALPIAEATGLDYASTRPGMMHACGHDGHIAMLLGAAKILCAMREGLTGTVKFVFQPGEEVRALGKKLVEAGVLENPKADIVSAIHGWPGLPEGAVCCRPGAMMASAAHFHIAVKGRGGHGSAPAATVDPITAAAQAIMALQTIVSRNTDPRDTAVLSVCSVHAGNSSNVIPDEAKLAGTCRALTPEVAASLEEKMRRVLSGVCAACGASYEMDYQDLYRVSMNDPEAVGQVRRAAERAGLRYCELERPDMAAEDFSYYLAQCPGALIHLGLGETYTSLHRNTFDFNDRVLASGVAYLASFVSCPR